MKITTLTILLATSTTIVEGSSSIRGGGRITNNDQSITAAADNKSMVEILQSLNEERAPNNFKESTIQYYIATQQQQQQQQSKHNRNLSTADNNGAGYSAPNGCWYATQEDYDTEAPQHYPVYSAGWSGGYCSLRKSCTSGEGHDDGKSCCDNSYPGQPGDNCYEIAGIVRETEEPLGEMWYPNRNADPSVATCLSTLDATDKVVTTELFDTQLECCEEIYVEQGPQGPTDPCLQGTPGYTAPLAGTEDERWYPDYDVGYVDGTCLSNIDVPNPYRTEEELFDTQLECCQEKYGDQASGACLNSLPDGERPTTSPTGVDGGVAPFFFPNWSAKWEDQTCTNALEDGKVPSHVTEFFTFETELECCLEVYKTQESQACLDSLPAGQRPTSAPSSADEKGLTPFYYPMSSSSVKWADQACTNLLDEDGEVPVHVIEGQNTHETAEECCEAHYSTQVSGACMEAVYDSLPAGQRPTSAPTGEDGPLNNWYHNYNGDYDSATCDNTRIGFSNGVSPSDPDDRWSTRLECCENELGSQYNNKCYCWATACDPENDDDPCEDSATTTFDATVGADSCVGEDACRGATGTIGECCSSPSCRDIGSCIGETACLLFGYDGSAMEVAGSKIGKSSCIGQNSCTNSYGTIGDGSCTKGGDGNNDPSCPANTGNIKDGSCTGLGSCPVNSGDIGDKSCTTGGDSATTATTPSCPANTGTIGDRSCTAGLSCPANQGDIGNDSCDGEAACSANAGEIDDGSCKGKNACFEFGLDGPDSSIGKSSCLEESSCVTSYGTIGDGSCTKGGDGASDPSCPENSGTIGDGSCTGLGSCQGNSGTIGDGSCGGKLACASNTGTIGDDSCTAEKSCSSDSSLNARTIGNGSCKKTGACSNLSVDVGNNSCNRSEGCNDCAEEVLNNQCNGGLSTCPASCN